MSAAVPGLGPYVIRVLVAEGRTLVRAAMKVALETDGAQVVESVWDARGLLDAIARTEPDIVLIDAGLPGGGIEACTSIKDTDTPAKVIMLTDAADQSQLLASVEAGADGYCSRESSLEHLVGEIRRVHAGEASIPTGMLSVLLRDMIRRRRAELDVIERFSRMSRREREVLALLVEGLDQGAIAERLVLSLQTVRTHIQRALERLGVHSRLEAIALVLEHDLFARISATDGDVA